ISGFISASGVLIALSQIKHILGVEVGGQNLPALLPALWQNLPDIHWPTAIIGGSALLFLQWMRKGAGSFLQRFKLSQASISLLTKVGPVLAIVVSVLVVWRLGLAEQGVKLVGEVPKGLPVFIVPTVDVALVQLLFPAALLISLVGFVESISVAQTLAAKRRQRIHPDQELVGLGTASLASAVSGGFPVTGGFSRSVVNYDAGAQTQIAGVFTAIGIGLT